VNALTVAVLVYLHARYNLSDLGFRSRGVAGDVAALALMISLGTAAARLSGGGLPPAPGGALHTALDRLFANPASTLENLFYFGFLTERISRRVGGWAAPIVVGLMYTLHEMTNPEYWYEGLSFPMVFLGVAGAACFYVWRRSTIVVWLGDGLGRAARVLVGGGAL
jgi:membrane protease YdiL (CAAX protease family)